MDYDFYSLYKKDLESSINIYSNAFFNDPLWSYIMPDVEKRRKHLRKFFQILVKYDFKYMLPFGTGDPLEGVSIWAPPGKESISVWGMIRSGAAKLLFSPFIMGFYKVRKLFIQSEKMHHNYAPEPHYYLSLLSISPKSQGKGLAGKLIRPMIKKAIEDKVPIYLETMNPKNVEMYEHFGFKIMEHYIDSKTKLNIWAFKN